MDENNKNNDSLNSMNSLFGTNISVNNKSKENSKEIVEETNKNETIKPNDNIKQNNSEPIKNENTIKEEQYKPIIEPTIEIKPKEEKENNSKETPSNNTGDTSLIGELIDTVEHFDLSKVKFNIALIGFIISLIGAVIYNLIITTPGVIISYFAYQKTKEGKLTKEDKLFSILGMVLGVCCVLSLIITKISSLFY